MHIIFLCPAIFTGLLFTLRTPQSSASHLVHLFVPSPSPLMIALSAMRNSKPQIHPFINTASHSVAFAIQGDVDSPRLVQLVLVSNASGKIVQAEEAFSAITEQGIIWCIHLGLGPSKSVQDWLLV